MAVISLTFAVFLVSVSTLPSAEAEHQYREVHGVLENGNRCVCKMQLSEWEFPVERFGQLQDLSRNCTTSLEERKSEATFAESRIPEFQAQIRNLSSQLQQFEAMYKQKLYHPLNFWTLRWELKQLSSEVAKAQSDPSSNTDLLRKVSTEMLDTHLKVKNLQQYDKQNLLFMKDHLKKMKNQLESFSVYGNLHIGNCSGGILRNISEPVLAQLNPYGTSYHYGGWGMDSMPGSPQHYWVMALLSYNIYGNVVRTYNSYKDFLTAKSNIDISVKSSYTATNAIQGPGVVVYNNSLYYNCYNSGQMCRFNIATKGITNVVLPNAGYNNKFPYCYYDCYGHTDMDFSVDENGIWVIYATENNYGNIVLSKIDSISLAVLQTWKTKLFKKAVTNAFVVCGVLYATRYVSNTEEEIFYMYDTITNQEAKNLNIRFVKYSPNVANIHYNPVDRKLYIFNGGYMIAYELLFY
ncbi:olfactomedin-4 [Carcharodon carcharias]|uniref:olfactomedin-4 n=1 Tax=Carcharodon carcharias TaxID=13397 RepID=UPI001B7E5FD5|nr:olfactomedin-4 [Carcharodon carcharias]